MKNFLETIILLSVAGIGIAGIMPDKWAKSPYEINKERDEIYKKKQDSLYVDYLTKQDSLENWYFSKSIK